MAQLGADDVALDQLATTFERTSSNLTTTAESISTMVRTVVWAGPDADVFRGRWTSVMRPQVATVSQRLTTIATQLRAQADAQRTTSEGTDVLFGTTPVQPDDDMAELRRIHAEQVRRLAMADAWAEDVGRVQIRDLADASERAQLDWWNGLTPDQQAALLRNDPGALSGLDGLPPQVLTDARRAYVDSVRPDLEISTNEDKLTGELNIAWIHLGVEGTAAIVQLADGTYRVDLKLDGEIGANVGSKGAEGHVGVGGAVSQRYTFDSQADAEAFVDGLYDKLTPDVGWSAFGGPGAIMADTVDDVVGYLGDHSDQRTAFEGELRIEGEVDLELGAFDVNLSGEAGARYDFDSKETTLFVGASASGELKVPSVAPTDGAGETGSVSLSADLEAAVTFGADGKISELTLSGTFGGEGQVGIEQFFNGTNAGSKTPNSFDVSAAGGADVRFDASLDLQDPIVQQRAATLLNSMGHGGVSLGDLQGLLKESEVQVQVDATTTSTDGLDLGIASIEISEANSQNVLTWVKPPGGDFLYLPQGELRGGSQ